MDDRQSANTHRRAVVDYLESLARAGVTHLPPPAVPRDTGPEVSPAGQVSTSSTPTSSVAEGGRLTAAEPPHLPEPNLTENSLLPDQTERNAVDAWPVIPAEERPAALSVISREVASCTRCEELAGTRTQTVFGVGSPQSRLCFMGEAPGADEDRQGEPFVGRAGQLLTKIIQACTLSRDDVYILNTLKCRPPGNRNPLPDEIAHCREFLDRQLKVIQPEFICCLGAVAAKALLSTETSIGRLRGRFHDYLGIRVLCTYHPAYLLRNPSAKKQVWEDMQMLMAEMGIALPEKR